MRNVQFHCDLSAVEMVDGLIQDMEAALAGEHRGWAGDPRRMLQLWVAQMVDLSEAIEQGRITESYPDE